MRSSTASEARGQLGIARRSAPPGAAFKCFHLTSIAARAATLVSLAALATSPSV
jgi:hypothetical protein